MDAPQLSFTDMTTVLKTTINTFDILVLAGIQNFNPAHAAFLASRSRIFGYFSQQSLDRSGNEINKTTARTNLSTITLDFVAKMVSYAGAVGNNALLNEINFTKSELERQTDLEFIASCTIISQKATQNLTALIPYGITAPNITDYDANREAFDVLKPLPIAGRNIKKEATAEIKAEIKFAKTQLLIMDRAIRTVKLSHPLLYKSYFNARETIDPKTRTRSGKGSLTDQAGEPLPLVMMTCHELGIKRKISPKGTFYIQTVPNGKYTFIFARIGYKTVTKNIVFYHGTSVEINIVMELDE